MDMSRLIKWSISYMVNAETLRHGVVRIVAMRPNTQLRAVHQTNYRQDQGIHYINSI